MQTSNRPKTAAANRRLEKEQVQWLNDPDGYRDCASYEVPLRQTVFVSEIASFL